MARKFLTHLDMAGNQILNAALQRLTTDPTTGNFEGRLYYNTTDEVVKVYTTTDGWLAVGAITDIQGTANEVEVSIDAAGVATIGLPASISVDVIGNITGNADTATALQTARTISLGGDLSGSASFDGTANVTISATVQPDSVGLGTDTTGDYVESVTAGTGISVTGTGEGAAVTVTNSDKGSDQNIFKTVTDGTNNIVAASNNDTVTFSGTANEVTVDALTGSVVIGLPDDVTIGNDLTVNGDLTVSGTTTTVNTETINLADNIITLNSNYAGSAPSENAGIEVERGTVDNNVVLRWNETTDVWEATLDGTNYSTILLSGDAASTDISDFVEAAQDAVGAALTDTSTIDFTYTDGSDTIEAAVILAASGGLTDNSGVAVDYATVEAQLVTDGFTKKAAADVGNTTNTSFAVTHNLGTRDVVVNIYDNTTFDTVEADVVRTDANNVTVSFNTAPATNEYRVVVIG